MTATMLDEINDVDRTLTDRFRDKLAVNYDLDRGLVSFQANKSENEHRWCKYKEGFSAALIRYIFSRVGINNGSVLDPFAGSGTTLFIASERGCRATGIELLPSSAEIIDVRRSLLNCDRRSLAAQLRVFAQQRVWEKSGCRKSFPHLRITSVAFPPDTEVALERYLYEVDQFQDKAVGRVLRFAAMCVLEIVSYTRKDGQYLRWDVRSGRRQGTKPFDKGKIYGFTEAITRKLSEIAEDLDPRELLFSPNGESQKPGEINLLVGSCLDVLPTLKSNSFDALVTSPPYCNRYDYTRTYALELAMLGVDEDSIKELRQSMLTCTVENRVKENLCKGFQKDYFQRALDAFNSQELLQLVLRYLDDCRVRRAINNMGIPRMVRNYFLELAVVLSDCARVLKSGAPLVMVNDNVRYQGAHIPVDLVLAEIAERIGFEVDAIWVLPKGKGNSSQQMGAHGRCELRKCVYVWRKVKAPTARKRGSQFAAVE